jgi:hypothetical protein
VSGLHPTTTTEPERLAMYPALNRLERRPELMPTKYGREPFWRAPITPASADVHIPHWNWTHIIQPDAGTEAVTLDANGAYLAAIGSVIIAHSHLTRTGRIEEPIGAREVLPGYYKIRIPHWALDGSIVSPLGDSLTGTAVWIAHPTLVLLLELLDQQALGDVEIIDSWTARVVTDFRKWGAHMRNMRADILDARDQCQTDAAEDAVLDQYDRFKEGYSAALSMMLTGDSCQTRRPDWAHAVYAQHAATMWRNGWKWIGTGRPLLSMGRVDEITVLAADLPEIMSRPKPPFRFDDTGRTLGALKTKAPTDTTPTPRGPSVDYPDLAEGEDIL